MTLGVWTGGLLLGLGTGLRGALPVRPQAARALVMPMGAGEEAVDQRAAQIAGAGLQVVPELLEIWAAGEAKWAVTEDHHRVVPLGEEHRRCMVRAIARFPRSEWLKAFRTMDFEGAPKLRGAALEVIGRLDPKGDPALLVEFGTLGEGERFTRALSASFRQALTTSLTRVPDAADRLEIAFRDVPQALLRDFIGVLSELPPAQALLGLSGLLRERKAFDGQILMHIAELATQVPHPVDPVILDSLRFQLEVGDPSLQQGVVFALGKLEDEQSIPKLLDLLEGDSSALRAAALAALREIAGCDLGARAVEWRGWYTAQRYWMDHAGSQLLYSLPHAPASHVATGIQNLARRRVFRHEIAPGLVQVLQRQEPELVVLACVALEELDSWAAVPGLVGALDDRAEKVRVAAHRALMGITGLDLPLDKPLWEDAWNAQ